MELLELHHLWNRERLRDTRQRLLGIMDVLDRSFDTSVRIISRRTEEELSHPFWGKFVSDLAALGVACAGLREAVDALERCGEVDLR
jgi:hypothetical protein